jgi:hypothetical protein
MLGPAYLQIDDAGGEMAFGAVQIGLRCEYGTTSIFALIRRLKQPSTLCDHRRSVGRGTGLISAVSRAFVKQLTLGGCVPPQGYRDR